MKFIQMIVITLILIKVRPVNCQNIWKLTLHSVKENWNDANAICRYHGGRLAQPRTHRQIQIFKKLLDSPLWADHVGKSTFIGLAWSPQSDAFQWIRCSGGSFDLSVNAGLCGAWDSNTSLPFQTSCFAQPKTFVCAAIHEHSSCSVEPYTGRVPIDTTNLTKTQRNSATTLKKCYNNCNSADINCMAFSFSNESKSCWLYKPPDPTHFYQGNNLAINASTDTYIKECFLANVHSDPHLVRHSLALTPSRRPCQANEQVGASNQKIIYIFYLRASTWYEAKRICESMGHALAEFDSASKRLIIPQLMFNLSSQLYWTGFHYTDHEISWLKSGVPVNPRPVIDTINNGSFSCGATLLPDMINNLLPCTTNLPFVCQKRRGANECGFLITPQNLLRGDLETAPSDKPEVIARDILLNPQGSHCFSCPNTPGQACSLLRTSSWEDCFSGDNNQFNSINTSEGWSSYRMSCYSVLEWKDNQHSDVNTTSDDITTPLESTISTARGFMTTLIDGLTTSSDTITTPTDTITTPRNTIITLSDIVTTPSDIVTTPGDIVTAPSDSVTLPTPSDIVTTPNYIVTTPGDIVTTPSDSVTTPGGIVTTPGDIVTAPSDSVTLPTPSDIVTTPDDIVTAPSDSVTLPTPSDIVTTPNYIVTTPGDIVTTPGDIVTPPGDIVTTPSDIITIPSDIVTTSSDIVTTVNDIIISATDNDRSSDTTSDDEQPVAHLNYHLLNLTNGIEAESTTTPLSTFTTQKRPLIQTDISTDATHKHTLAVSSTESTDSSHISTTLSTSSWYSSSLAEFSLCNCACSNASLSVDFSNNKLNFTEFIEELGRFSRNSSSVSRRKESAKDPRTSSAFMGVIATVLMSLFFTFLVGSDSYYLYKLIVALKVKY